MGVTKENLLEFWKNTQGCPAKWVNSHVNFVQKENYINCNYKFYFCHLHL